jgi:hypothetical protein
MSMPSDVPILWDTNFKYSQFHKTLTKTKDAVNKTQNLHLPKEKGISEGLQRMCWNKILTYENWEKNPRAVR